MTDDLQRKIIAKVYIRVSAVVFGLSDEGDRVYLGSTNDADILRDLSAEWDVHRILGEEILSSEQEVAALKVRAERAEAESARLTDELDAALAECVSLRSETLRLAGRLIDRGELEEHRQLQAEPNRGADEGPYDRGYVWGYRHGLREADAELARRGQVQVKPLVWEQLGEKAWRAPSPLFGTFRVECYGGRPWQALWSVPGFCDTFVEGEFATTDDAKQAIESRIRAALVSPGDGWQPTHRHKKRGSTYVEIGRGKLQTDTPLTDYAELVAYRAEDGELWFRPPSEFDDGRFEVLAPPASEGAAHD